VEGTVENEDGLRALFDDEPASDALVAWARDGGHGGVVRPVLPPWRPSGASASGALLTAVLVTPGPGPVVVKVSAAGQGNEGHNHARAYRTAPDRVAQLLWAWQVGDGRTLTFQSPAGQSLRTVHTLAGLTHELPDACAYVTRWLLTEWNAGPDDMEAVTRTVTDLLRHELGALIGAGGSALAYGARIDGLDPDTPWIRLDDRDLPNPLALAAGHAALPDPPLHVLQGRAHGDLHLHNIMVPHRLGQARYEDFRLIDPATFTEDALLSRDVVTLLLSALIPEVRERAAADGDALLRYLVCPQAELRDRIVPATVRLVDAVREAADTVAGSWYDVWTDQFLLSVLATGLRFSTYENLGEAGRWWFFRLAAHAAGELLRPYVDEPWPTGRPVTAPAPPAAEPRQERPGPSHPAAGDGIPGRPGTDPPEELRRLEAYSRTAVVAAGHQGASGAGAQPLDLTALAVPRDLEWSLLSLLHEGRSACVTGPPGTGKTTLLWRLHRELAGRPGGPRPYFLRAGDLWHADHAAGMPLETVRAACRSMPGPAVFLLDTADLLVSDTPGLVLVRELLTAAAEFSVPVLMTCRENVADHLKPYVDDFALQWKKLGPYSPAEQEAAIRSHARYFYEGQPEVSVDEVCRTVANAAVRGLPMREVCRAPLTLRMLFETFAPKPPLVEEIDATTLYDLYWEHRVGRDQRAGDTPAPGTAPPPDLSETGEKVARLMLEEGRLDLSAAELGPGPLGAGATDDLQGLVGRGVIECHGEGVARRYSYFHQTLFEYAAGRRLARTATDTEPSHLAQLLHWLTQHPDDQFRLAVAEQALVQAGRAGGRTAAAGTDLLTGLLAETRDGAPDLHGLRAVLMRVYARLPAPDAELRQHFGPAVASLPPVLGRIYLEALPTTCHQDRERIVDELLGIWRAGHEELRQPLLGALGWLAESMPESVISVIDQACSAAERGDGPCGGRDCAPEGCLWAWLLTRHKSEIFKFLAVLEALAPKRPDWVWPRLRTLMTDPRRDLLPVARCLRLAARRQDWPERPYSVIRPVVRQRWGRERPRNKDGFELQVALGRLIASTWLTGGRPPSPEAVLAAACRRPEESMSYPQVRAVGERAVQASRDEVRRLLHVVETVGGPGAMPLLTDHFLLPLLTAADGPDDTIGGDTPSSRVGGAEPAATATVRDWLAGKLRALDQGAPADFGHRLAEHTWSRRLDVPTTARLVAAAWPRPSGDPTEAEDRLRRIWLADQSAVTLLVAAVAAGHPQARQALRLWRADRARTTGTRAASRKQVVSQADQKIAHDLQRLVPEHPELLDELLTEGTIDPWLDPGWLNEALGKPGADADPRLTAALRRHARTLERLCDVTWTGDHGSQVAKKSFHLRGKLVARGVLSVLTATRLGAILTKGGHPHHIRSALLLVETIIDHSPNGSLATQEWRRLEELLHGYLRPDYTRHRTGPGKGWYEDVQAVARRCLTGLVCRHHPLDTPQRIAQACARAHDHLTRATQVDDVTVLGRFIERLAETSPRHAVEIVDATAATLCVLPKGKGMSLAQRWYRPLSRLVERATSEQWQFLLAACWEGPLEVLRVLIRAGIRIRTDEPAAHLLALADTSPWPDVIRETVRIGSLLRTDGSRRRWLPADDRPRPSSDIGAASTMRGR
jgi:hypothetical protein